MTDERRQELMKEQKKYLINRIENLENIIENYRKTVEDLNKEIEHLKSAHRTEIETIKEDAYSKFVTSNGEHLERFVKEFIQEKLMVNMNIDGPFLSTSVFIAGEQGQTSSSEMIKQDTYGTII